MSITILTYVHGNVGGYLFEESVRNLFKQQFDSILEIKNNQLIEGNLLNKVNQTKCIIIAGGPIIGNDGAYGNSFMGFIKLNPNLDLIKVPIILFGVGVISIPFKNRNLDRLNNNALYFLNRVSKIYTRDKLTERYLKSNNINCDFMGCPSLSYKSNNNLSLNNSQVKNILFSPSIFLNNKDIECYNKLTSYGRVIVTINHNNVDIEAKAKKLFYNSEVVRLTNVEQMLELNKRVDMHIGFRVHQHIASLISDIKSLLVICDNRGGGMTEVLGNNKYSVNNINEIIDKIKMLENDDYSDVYRDIEQIRNNIGNIIKNIKEY